VITPPATPARVSRRDLLSAFSRDVSRFGVVETRKVGSRACVAATDPPGLEGLPHVPESRRERAETPSSAREPHWTSLTRGLHARQTRAARAPTQTLALGAGTRPMPATPTGERTERRLKQWYAPLTFGVMGVRRRPINAKGSGSVTPVESVWPLRPGRDSPFYPRRARTPRHDRRR